MRFDALISEFYRIERSKFMAQRLDLAAYDRDDQLALVVEVKRKVDASKDWVSQLRRNIMAHGVFPNPPFFLLALPDRFYLWKNGNDNASEPSYAIDAEPLLRPYFERAGVQADKISSQSLELMVAAWLNELVHTGKKPSELESSEQWLIESGLYEALMGGRLDREPGV
jgi:hypothetical protein